MRGQIIQIETISGEPIQAGQFTTTSFARVLRLHIPGLNLGLSWNRPASVLVKDQTGEELIIPIIDTTRQLQHVILTAALLGAVFAWLAVRRRK